MSKYDICSIAGNVLRLTDSWLFSSQFWLGAVISSKKRGKNFLNIYLTFKMLFMNYLQSSIEKLNLNGVYYTPEIIQKQIQMEATKSIIGNPPFKVKVKKQMAVYIDFLDCKNKYIQTRKDFETYEKAWKWMLKTFDNPNRDFINYY